MIDERTRDTRAPTHPNLVLGPRGGPSTVIATADALGPEQIVVTATVPHERALGGVSARGLILDHGLGLVNACVGGLPGNLWNMIPRKTMGFLDAYLYLRSCPRCLLAVGAHGNLVDIAPERAEVHEPGRSRTDQVRIDSVVVLARRGGNARSAMVSP